MHNHDDKYRSRQLHRTVYRNVKNIKGLLTVFSHRLHEHDVIVLCYTDYNSNMIYIISLTKLAELSLKVCVFVLSFG